MDNLKNFFDFLESMSEPKKTAKVLSFSNENLINEKTEEFKDFTLITKVYQAGNTTVTVEVKKFPEESESSKSMWKEAIQSIIEDLDQEISWAIENEKFELAAECKRKKDFLKGQL